LRISLRSNTELAGTPFCWTIHLNTSLAAISPAREAGPPASNTSAAAASAAASSPNGTLIRRPASLADAWPELLSWSLSQSRVSRPLFLTAGNPPGGRPPGGGGFVDGGVFFGGSFLVSAGG